MDKIVIEADSVTKLYGKVRALDAVSIKIKKGSIFGIVGPDGAGKSTFLKVIASIEKISSGKISYFNMKRNSGSTAENEIAFMPEGLGANLYDELSVKENLEFFSDLSGKSDKKFHDELYRASGLYKFKNRKQKNLSGGMSQKLGLISTIVQKPEIIILDEPTTGVDPLSRLELWRLIYRFNRDNGTTFIISTSYIYESSNCTDLALIYNGKIVASGKPEELASPEELFLKSISSDKINFKLPLDLITLPDVVIKTDKLTKAYGKFFAMKNVSITMKSGDIVGLIGANGAGKTTLIKSLTGVLKTTSGKFWILGESGRDMRSEIGYMSQKFSLYNDMSVKENLRLFGTIYRVKNLPKRIDIVTGTLKLRSFLNYLTEDLPIGIRQRVAFASAILHFPKLLFLDEPTSGVDPVTRRQFWELIKQFALTGRSVLFSTHYLDEAARCKSIIFMHEGKVLAAGTDKEIISEVSEKDENIDIEQAFIRYIKPAAQEDYEH